MLKAVKQCLYLLSSEDFGDEHKAGLCALLLAHQREVIECNDEELIFMYINYVDGCDVANLYERLIQLSSHHLDRMPNLLKVNQVEGLDVKIYNFLIEKCFIQGFVPLDYYGEECDVDPLNYVKACLEMGAIKRIVSLLEEELISSEDEERIREYVLSTGCGLYTKIIGSYERTLWDAAMNSVDTELGCSRFDRHYSIDFFRNDMQERVISSNNPFVICKYARYVSTVKNATYEDDIKPLEDKIVEIGDIGYIKKFVNVVKMADKERLASVIEQLSADDPENY